MINFYVFFIYKKFYFQQTFLFQTTRGRIGDLIVADLFSGTDQLPAAEFLSPSRAMASIETSDDIEKCLKRLGEYFFFYTWWPMKVMKENVKLAASLASIFVTWDASGHLAALSFQCCSPSLQGTRLDITFYGSGAHHYLDHLRRQLKRALEVTRAEQYNILLPEPMDLEVKRIEHFLHHHLGARHKFKGDPRNQFILTGPYSNI